MGHRGRLILLLVVLALPLRGWADSTTYAGLAVEEVIFDAPPSVEVAELRYLVEVEVGGIYRPGDVRRSIELLYSLGIFQEVYATVMPDGARLFVTFHLVPSPQIQRVVITGLPATTTPARARDGLTIRRGDRFFDGDGELMARELEFQLASEGYLEAQVTPTVRMLDAEKLIVELEVAPSLPYTVASIQFNPGAGLSERKLRSHIRASLMEGKRFQRSKLEARSQGLEKLFRKQDYLEARVLTPLVEADPARREVSIIYNIVPGRRVEVAFVESDGSGKPDGLNTLGPRDRRNLRLRRAIGVENERWLSAGYVRVAVTRVHKTYQELGYHQVRVEGELEEVGDIKRLEFIIIPGPLSVLASSQDLGVKGNTVLKDRELRLMLRDQMSYPVPLGRPRVTDEGLAAGIEDVEYRYRSMGYMDPVVTLMEVERIPRGALPQRTVVGVTIAEGVMTTVRDVEIRGNRRVSDERLHKLVEPLLGQPLRRPEVDQTLADLHALYGDRGYMDVRIESTADFSEDGTEATLIWDINEGQQVRFGKVLVRGNRHTRSWVIRNELSMEPGRVWRTREVEKSQARLKETGLFSQIRVRPLNTSSRVRDVLIEVGERKRWRLLLGPGISSAEGARLVAENHVSNIGGVGHRWTTYFHWGIDWENIELLVRQISGLESLGSSNPVQSEWKLVTGYDLDYIPRARVRASVRVLLNERVLQPTYIVQRYGLGLAAVWDPELPTPRKLKGVKTNLRVLGGYDLIWRYPEDADPAAELCAADVVDPDFGSRFLGLLGADTTPASLRRLGLFKATVRLDVKDDPFNPTRGIHHKLEIQGTDLGTLSQEHFGQFRHRFTMYLPLGDATERQWGFRAFDIASSIEWGIGWLGPDTEMLPIEYRYRLGGVTSVRGYRLETLGPTVERPMSLTDDGFTEGTVRVPVGGDVFYSFNVEMKVPTSRSDSWHMIVFVDGGNAFLRSGEDSDELDRGLDPWIRTSAGLGVRVKTPVGPLRLDGGVQLGQQSPLFFPKRNDEMWYQGMALHFSVGAM